MDQKAKSTAGLVHLSIILPLWGPIIALLVWFNNKEKSEDVAFHSLQSLLYQLAVYAILIVGGIFHLVLKFLEFIRFCCIIAIERRNHAKRFKFLKVFVSQFPLINR